jgi:hypothetical protein
VHLNYSFCCSCLFSVKIENTNLDEKGNTKFIAFQEDNRRPRWVEIIEYTLRNRSDFVTRVIDKGRLRAVRQITYTFVRPTIRGVLLGLSPRAVTIAKGSDFCIIPPIFFSLLALKEIWSRVVAGLNDSLSSLMVGLGTSTLPSSSSILETAMALSIFFCGFFKTVFPFCRFFCLPQFLWFFFEMGRVCEMRVRGYRYRYVYWYFE